LSLADQLLADAGAHRRQHGIRSSDDPALEDELNRRLADRDSEAWLSVSEFKTRTKRR
jgi:hypothetical protein